VAVVALMAMVGVAGCSSSGHAPSDQHDTTSTTRAAADPAASVTAFCVAWGHLTTLDQQTADTDLSDVATNITALRAIAQQLQTQAPPSIAGPARRYGAVVAAVANTLDPTNASSTGTSTGASQQLSAADRTTLARYMKAHCPTS
jgi:hypothetical protein